MRVLSVRGSLKEPAARGRETERQRDRAGRLFRIEHADCQGVPEGTSGAKGEIERQRDRTRRLFRIEQ